MISSFYEKRKAPKAAKGELVRALRQPQCYPHPVQSIEVLETHISWVILTGEYAYKIKKPVSLGFLDFSTLRLRRHYCEEELRLNRRFAPGMYLDVVPVRGSPPKPSINGEGPIIEYAVKMRQFPQEALASRALARRAFGEAEVDALAALIAEFHARSPTARPDERFGAPDTVLAAALQNFEQMAPLLKASSDKGLLRELQRWTEREFAARRDAFATRKRDGFVRECHGDLHLGNVVLMHGRPVPFDCIEFNDELRWIDVMSEIAFVVMDLEDRKRGHLAWRFLNRYLEATGDYGGLEVFRFYAVYRALVRAKVHLMRSRQPRLLRTEKSRLMHACRDYLALAQRLAAPARPGLVITHGLSGCGKTTATQPLIEWLGAVRVRSDLERKRLHGVAALASSRSQVGVGIYTRDANAATYRRLGEIARIVIEAGYPVVADATLLKRTEREAFRALAEKCDVPLVILNFNAPFAVLRARVAARKARADDASEADAAVLERQVGQREPLTPAEMAATVDVDGTRAGTRESWQPVIERLRRRARRKRGCAAHPSLGQGL